MSVELERRVWDTLLEVEAAQDLTLVSQCFSVLLLIEIEFICEKTMLHLEDGDFGHRARQLLKYLLDQQGVLVGHLPLAVVLKNSPSDRLGLNKLFSFDHQAQDLNHIVSSRVKLSASEEKLDSTVPVDFFVMSE